MTPQYKLIWETYIAGPQNGNHRGLDPLGWANSQGLILTEEEVP